MNDMRDEVHDVLTRWSEHEWQVQGFGMLRTYLPGNTEPRLQVWDQRLACWGNNAIHDHPWAFRSTIVAGTVFNQRFVVDREWPEEWIPANGHTTEIIPGIRGGKLSERPVVPCKITPLPVEVYSMGDAYLQTHREMHLTRYVQSSVTLIERFDREDADVARVAWWGEAYEQPPFVDPYPAPPELTEQVITDALKAWWLPLFRQVLPEGGSAMPRCSDGKWCIDDLCHFTERTLCGRYPAEDLDDDEGFDWDDGAAAEEVPSER